MDVTKMHGCANDVHILLRSKSFCQYQDLSC
jgi:hypothetical protein